MVRRVAGLRSYASRRTRASSGGSAARMAFPSDVLCRRSRDPATDDIRRLRALSAISR